MPAKEFNPDGVSRTEFPAASGHRGGLGDTLALGLDPRVPQWGAGLAPLV